MFVGKSIAGLVLAVIIGLSGLVGGGVTMFKQAQDADLIPQSATEIDLIRELVAAQKEQEIAAAQIAAIQAGAEVQIVRETGKADVNLTDARTDAYVRKLYADARVDLATNGIKVRQSWRVFFQITGFMCAVVCAGAAGVGWINKQSKATG